MNKNKIKFTIGNITKIGKAAGFSREAGPSCPSDCTHYNSDCYAMKIQRIYPNALKAWRHNLDISDWQQYRAMLVESKKKDVPLRIHISGDFIKKDSLGREQLDVKYLNAWIKALDSLSQQEIPKIWLYTHVADKRILQLEKYGVSVYASIDNDSKLKKFKNKGFSLFAFNSNIKKNKAKHKFEIIDNKKVPVCWEQLGTKKDCVSCGYCIGAKPGQNIVFLNH